MRAPNEFAKAFGQRFADERRLKAFREHRDIYMTDVAMELGTTSQSVGRWEHGEAIPREEMLLKICAYFGVTVQWLRFGHRTEGRHYYRSKPETETPPG